MATIKLKRGLESKVPSLPKEDGSLIFGYNTASVPATMQLDQSINGTVQRLNLSVANSETSSYAKNSGALGGSSLSQVLAQAGSGNAFTGIDTATNNTVKLTRANGGTVQKVIDNVAHATSATISSTSNIAKNSNALGGSSLKNLIDKINTTSGSGNAFTGLDTATNNVVKLTRANGGTVQKTIDNVAHATSATIASSANRINPTLSLTGGDGNTTGYRLVATISIPAWSNYRGVFAIKSRHTGGGILTISVGCNSTPVSQNNAYFEIKYWGPTSSASIISSDSWQGYISSDGTKGYLFWKYNDYNACYVTQLSSDFTLSNGTWMTSISSSYGIRKSSTSINYASDSAALGGSSLQNIIDKINSTSGSGNAFTSIDTSTNNIVKLTRANGGTVQKVIDNVSHASTSSYSSNSGQLQGHTITTAGSGSSATFSNHIPYISGSVLEIARYIDFHGDATSRDYSTRLDASTPSKLVVSGPSASTVTAAYFDGNAKNSNALGGSSLSQILSNISSKVGASTYLNNCFTSRPADANIGITGKGGIRTFKATNSMTTHKPTSDGHILHFDWDNTGGYDSQLFLSNSSSPHVQIRGMSGGTWGSWINVLDQNNYATYIPIRTKTINAGFSTAFRTQTQESKSYGSFLSMIRNNTASVPYSPQYGSGLAWGHSDTHGYLYVSYNSPDVSIGGGNGDKLVWMKKIAFTDTKISNASTADFSKNSNALGGSSLSQILNSINSGNVSADSATRIISSTKSVANNFTIRTGTPTSSGWSQHPAYHLYNTSDADLTAYKGKSVSLLHMDGGAQRHDIVALNSANDGLLYATASSTDGSARIERILDGGNYGSLITNLSKQVTFSNGLKAQKNVQMDGGNFSSGSTVTTGNGKTTIPNVHFSVSGKTLIITTK